jgi:hypothetical protein
MNRNMFDDSRDEALADALRAAVPEPPLAEVDWQRLQARIAVDAAGHFGNAAVAPVRGMQPWWQPLASWSSRGIPLAAAASVLLMIGAAAIGTAARSAGPSAASAIAFHTVEEELANGVSNGARPLLAGIESDGMLDVVLFYDGEDW